jgi:hypothetical protein
MLRGGALARIVETLDERACERGGESSAVVRGIADAR